MNRRNSPVHSTPGVSLRPVANYTYHLTNSSHTTKKNVHRYKRCTRWFNGWNYEDWILFYYLTTPQYQVGIQVGIGLWKKYLRKTADPTIEWHNIALIAMGEGFEAAIKYCMEHDDAKPRYRRPNL
jgi:hypothetical protein